MATVTASQARKASRIVVTVSPRRVTTKKNICATGG
jgi:hypothetical protein